MDDLKINQDKCSVDKRSLVLNFDFNGRNYIFSYNGRAEPYPVYYRIDGKEVRYTLLQDYKHCIQAAMTLDYEDVTVFIDRRYEHNTSYDVYCAGKHYLVGKEHKIEF